MNCVNGCTSDMWLNELIQLCQDFTVIINNGFYSKHECIYAALYIILKHSACCSRSHDLLYFYSWHAGHYWQKNVVA